MKCKHEFVETGQSPITGKVWRNCKHCDLPIEKLDPNEGFEDNGTEWVREYSITLPAGCYIDEAVFDSSLWKDLTKRKGSES